MGWVARWGGRYGSWASKSFRKAKKGFLSL